MTHLCGLGHGDGRVRGVGAESGAAPRHELVLPPFPLQNRQHLRRKESRAPEASRPKKAPASQGFTIGVAQRGSECGPTRRWKANFTLLNFEDRGVTVFVGQCGPLDAPESLVAVRKAQCLDEMH